MTAGFDFTPLHAAAHAEIDGGLRAAQVAVGHDGAVVWSATFGDATPDMRFHVMSATKPIVASAIWLLIGEGKLDISQPVAHYVPGFGDTGKAEVTIEQVLLMTAGFPSATMTEDEGRDPQ